MNGRDGEADAGESRLLAGYARWVVRHRRFVLAVVAGLTLLLGRAATRLHVEIDPDNQLPQDHPYIQTLNDLHRLFGDKNLVVVGLFPHDGKVFTPRFLGKLAEVTDRIRKVPGANQALVQSLAAPQVKDIQGTADGMEVERVMAEPPADQAGADEVRRRALANDAYVGTLVAADGSAAAIQASFELTPVTPGYRHLHEGVLAAVRAADDGTFDYRLSAPVVFLSRLTAHAARVVYYFPRSQSSSPSSRRSGPACRRRAAASAIARPPPIPGSTRSSAPRGALPPARLGAGSSPARRSSSRARRSSPRASEST